MVGRSRALRKNRKAERCRLRNCRQRSEEPGPGLGAEQEPGREASSGGSSSSKQRQREREGLDAKAAREEKKPISTSIKNRVMMMNIIIAIKEEKERLLIEERKI